MCTCTHKRHRLSSTRQFYNIRKSAVPEGGWTTEHLNTREGRRLVRDIVLVQNAAKLRGMRSLTAYLQAKMNELVETIILNVMNAKVRRGETKGVAHKITFEANPVGDEALWAQALQTVMGEYDKELLVEMTPRLQSVASEVYGKTAILLGDSPLRDAPARILSQVRPIAEQVTRVNDTTRKQIADIIGRGLDAGKPVNGVALDLRDALPEVMHRRIPTIARTEMGRAADAGSALSFHSSQTVKTIKVIGCQAVEPGIPTFEGRPTCNIKNVPADRCRELQFHINHTGCMVPESFYDHKLPPLPPKPKPKPKPKPPKKAPSLMDRYVPTRKTGKLGDLSLRGNEVRKAMLDKNLRGNPRVMEAYNKWKELDDKMKAWDKSPLGGVKAAGGWDAWVGFNRERRILRHQWNNELAQVALEELQLPVESRANIQVEVTQKTAPTTTYNGETTTGKQKLKELKTSVNKGSDRLNAHVSKDVVKKDRLTAELNEDRAFARTGQGLISVNRDLQEDFYTIEHEIAHHIEFDNPSVVAKTRAYLEKRRNGEQWTKLQDLTGNEGYRADEISYRDEWEEKGGSVYSGKRYDYLYQGHGSTELLTMGVQRYLTNPVLFAEQDPEYFDLVVDILRGHY